MLPENCVPLLLLLSADKKELDGRVRILLHYRMDQPQVMVIECSDQCGIAESSEAVTMLTTRAVDAKFDAPSVMYGDYAAQPLPTAAVPNFRKEENQSAR